MHSYLKACSDMWLKLKRNPDETLWHTRRLEKITVSRLINSKCCVIFFSSEWQKKTKMRPLIWIYIVIVSVILKDWRKSTNKYSYQSVTFYFERQLQIKMRPIIWAVWLYIVSIIAKIGSKWTSKIIILNIFNILQHISKPSYRMDLILPCSCSKFSITVWVRFGILTWKCTLPSILSQYEPWHVISNNVAFWHV